MYCSPFNSENYLSLVFQRQNPVLIFYCEIISNILCVLSFLYRWSAIAARLPGRTDNEIKNVWHTHLKKRLKKQLSIPDSKGQSAAEASSYDSDSFNSAGKMSPQPSSSDFSSGTMETQNSTDISNEQAEYSPESFPVIDESFWSDELSSDDSSMASDFPAVTDELQFLLPELESSNIIIDDGMDFWYDVFIGAGGLQEL